MPSGGKRGFDSADISLFLRTIVRVGQRTRRSLGLKHFREDKEGIMECANCGLIGHTFRDCSAPVMSYGIAAIKFIGAVPHYLLVRRRDSISYVEFLRGKYKLDNPEYITLLMNGMTISERARLQTGNFDTLWEALWNSQNTRQYRNECEAARRMYTSIKNTGDIHGRLLVQYIEHATTAWSEPEWGFPKGRRAVRESELSCALREFGEETGLAPSVVHIVDGEPMQVEEYTGTNGIRYKQVYFVGACASNNVAALQPSNRVMSREIGDIGWFPYAAAREKIRITNPEKRAVLDRIEARISDGDLAAALAAALEWSRT
jgi:8-oxo-dGTP pyrophosphatase MutT (NUDIX family)